MNISSITFTTYIFEMVLDLYYMHAYVFQLETAVDSMMETEPNERVEKMLQSGVKLTQNK